MSVVDIHPEELIDKRVAGSLSPSEAVHLDAHLARCEACRFELALRADLDEDVAAHRFAPPPQLLSNVPTISPEFGPRRMRRLSVAWVAAAAVLVLAAGALGAYAAPRVWPLVQRVEAPQVPSGAPRVVAAPSRKSQSRVASGAPSASANACPAPGACPSPSDEVSAPAASALVQEPSNARSLERAQRTRSRVAAPVDAPESSTAPATDEASAQALFSAANRARRSGDVGRASELYRSLQRQFPRSAEAALSRVTLATLLLNRDPAAALASFDAYLASGTQPLTAEALVGRARALRALGRSSEARRAWQEVQQRYPNSVYAVEAREAITSANGP